MLPAEHPVLWHWNSQPHCQDPRSLQRQRCRYQVQQVEQPQVLPHARPQALRRPVSDSHCQPVVKQTSRHSCQLPSQHTVEEERVFLFIFAPVALHFSLSPHSIAMINVTMRCFPNSLLSNIVMLLRSISVLAGRILLCSPIDHHVIGSPPPNRTMIKILIVEKKHACMYGYSHGRATRGSRTGSVLVCSSSQPYRMQATSHA